MLPARRGRERGLGLWDWPESKFFSPFSRSLFPEDWSESFGAAAYPVDMNESDDKIVVDAELPGFQRDGVHVDIQDSRLHIKAERAEEKTEGTSHVHERICNRVERLLSLPSEVDASKTTAKLKDGVLHIEMPKTERAGSNRIEIT